MERKNGRICVLTNDLGSTLPLPLTKIPVRGIGAERRARGIFDGFQDRMLTLAYMAAINKISITKKDLKDALKGVARAKDVNDLAGDLVRIEKKVDGIDERVERIEHIVEGLSKMDQMERRLERVEEKLGL